MPISNEDEYDKVVNVSWFTPEKPREELVFEKSISLRVLNYTDKTMQLSLRSTIFSNVPSMLHRYPKLFESVLLLLR